MKRVLFLCTGNYYRSRFAEIFFNDRAERAGLPWRAESRGLALDSGNIGPISPHTIAALANCGIRPVRPHRAPTAVSERDFRNASLVIAVKDAEHRSLIASNFPRWVQSVEFWHIDDLDAAGAEVAIPRLEAELLRLINRLLAGGGESRGGAGSSLST
jgi:protein-tyrosine phosphatase